jgi:sugar phosphate isomerase/epimerase
MKTPTNRSFSAGLSRRGFISRAAALAAVATVRPGDLFSASTDDLSKCPIVVFSKIYQELKLGFTEAASLTAEAGLNGVDCPVRPGGEILPERAAEDMPAYLEALRKRNLGMPLITTAILRTSSPQAEQILRTAKSLGVQYYRLGFVERDKDSNAATQIREFKAWLKDLAAMNKEIGIGALFQNHSAGGKPTSIGSNLPELVEIVSDSDPGQVGVAFDIGHALLIHGPEWRGWFEKLRSHVRIVYIKDAKRGAGFVRFGQGEIESSGYFTELKAMGYRAPFCIHIEFDWSRKGASKDAPTLVDALRESRVVLQRWLKDA